MDRRVITLAAALDSYEFVGTAGEIPTPQSIVYDSRQVTPGALFVCWKGQHYDGHAFAPEAVRNGATMLLCERRLDVLSDTPQIIVPDSRKAMAQVAAAFYGHPSERLRLIGVTGTNGKTTTTYLIKAVLEAADRRTGLIGTITGTRTTPESPDIQRTLAELVAQGYEACTMEVSSHGIASYRTEGCAFSIGLFTNLTQDHLDYHRSFEAYRDTKVRLFSELSEAAIINADDPHAGYFIKATSAPILRYGVKAKDADVTAEKIRVGPSGVEYVARTPSGSCNVKLALTGMFNVYNSLGAIAVGYQVGLRPEQIADALRSVQVPGRFESISQGQPFSVIVDYAHTPDGLENVLRTARDITSGRVIALFGAGGDRDASKRPLMGKLAAAYADYVIITSDNPRSEEPAAICDEIAIGVQQVGLSSSSYAIIVSRRAAIRQAIAMAEPGDLVLIAGKGHETYQEINGTRIHFDDREEAVLALEERFGSAKAHSH